MLSFKFAFDPKSGSPKGFAFIASECMGFLLQKLSDTFVDWQIRRMSKNRMKSIELSKS